MRGVGNSVIDQKLLAKDSPEAASLGQERLEAARELSCARLGIDRIRVVKTDVNLHVGMFMIPVTHLSHTGFFGKRGSPWP